MPFYHKILFRFLFSLLSIFSLQEVVSTQSMNLEGYQQLIAQKNPHLRQSENQLLLSQKDTRLAKAGLLPSVSADFNYQRDFTKSFLFLNDAGGGFPAKFRTNFNNNITASAVASQTLYSPAQVAVHKLSMLAEELAKYSHIDLTEELQMQASRLFWQAIYTRESMLVLTENQDLAKAQWQQTQALFEEGYASKFQLHQSESFYKRTLPQMESARNAYSVLLNEMKALANMPIDDSLQLEGVIIMSDAEINAMILADENIANNPQIKILQQQLVLADQQIEVSKAERYPIIQASLGYSLDAQDNGFKFENKNSLFYGQIGVQIPIYSGGSKQIQIEKDIIARENARIAIEQKQLELQKELQNVQLNFQTALQKIIEEKEAIALSEKQLEIAEFGIKEGTVTPLELKEIRLGLTQGKMNLLNAHLDLRIAQVTISRLLNF